MANATTSNISTDVQLTVILTAEQYARFKAGYQKMMSMSDAPTDDMLLAQLKREAAAVTCAGENN